ncbi:MAG: hypothetical protein JNM75_12100 [Rhodospirillales bacterium]|nr:hypothetical protein [Rhodospirillales bacterium]
MATFTGNWADETYSGGSGNDTINGGGGSDTLNGGGGNDTVCEEVWTEDSHTFTGTAILHGDAGNDRLFVDFDGPALDIERGTFKLYGDAGNDRLEATYYYPWSEGPNYGAAKDFLYGGTGDDTYVLQQHTDAVIEKAGEGYDTVIGWGDDYTLPANVEKLQLEYGVDDAPSGYHGTGNTLANTIVGTQADDTLDGAAGNDTLYGKPLGENWDWNEDADTIHGGTGNDLIYGAGGDNDTWDGDDLLYGDDGNDRIFGSYGDDQMYGGTGADELGGQAGNDTMYGGSGNDKLGGGSGNDWLYGEGDADVLSGRGDLDHLSGGPGNDIFDYDAVTDSKGAARDVILDFAGAGAAAGDRIDLSTIDANTTAGGNQAFKFVGTAAFSGPGQVRVAASGADTLIQVNTDANKATVEMDILVKDGAATPTQWVAGDFIL